MGSNRNRTQSRSFSLRVQYVFHYHKPAFISIISLSLESIPLQMSSYSLRTGSNTTFSLLLQHFQLLLQSFPHCVAIVFTSVLTARLVSQGTELCLMSNRICGTQLFINNRIRKPEDFKYEMKTGFLFFF